jgi:hypothetical protein
MDQPAADIRAPIIDRLQCFVLELPNEMHDAKRLHWLQFQLPAESDNPQCLHVYRLPT